MAEEISRTFTHLHRVSYHECAIGDHVYYSRYFEILETARGEFFRHLGFTFRDLHEQSQTVFPVSEAAIRYKRAARYDDALRVELWMSEIARVRLKFGFRILKDDMVLAEGETVHACTGVDEKFKRVPESLADKLQPYLRESSPAA